MTDLVGQHEDRPRSGPHPEDDGPDAEGRQLENRRSHLKLAVNFAIVVVFMAALLIGFCLYVYQRMTG